MKCRTEKGIRPRGTGIINSKNDVIAMKQPKFSAKLGDPKNENVYSRTQNVLPT